MVYCSGFLSVGQAQGEQQRKVQAHVYWARLFMDEKASTEDVYYFETINPPLLQSRPQRGTGKIQPDVKRFV